MFDLGKFRVLRSNEDFHYLDEVKDLSDVNKKYLGMIPYSALEDSYRRGEVLILICPEGFVGYLLYRIVPRHTRISITQLCIKDDYRRIGAPEPLLSSLKDLCVSMNYKGIFLNCRRDYIAASKVWAANFFKPISEKPGRGQSSEKILISWWWNNDHLKDLFGPNTNSHEKICAVLDVNLLVSLIQNDSEYSYLLDDTLIEEVELYVAPESLVETNRHEDQIIRTSMRTFIQKFAQLEIKDERLSDIEVGLQEIMPFESIQERSDIRQLAQSLSGEKTLFITLDNGILKRANLISQYYEINVLHPSDFWIYCDETIRSSAYQPSRLSGSSIVLRRVRAQDVQQLKSSFSHNNERNSDFGSHLRSFATEVEKINLLKIDSDNEVLALFAIKQVTSTEVEIPILRVSTQPSSYTIFAQILNYILQESARARVSLVVINDRFSSVPPDLALVFGFTKSGHSFFKRLEYGLGTNADLKLLSESKFSSEILGNIGTSNQLPPYEQEPLGYEKFFWPYKAIDLDVPIYVIPIRAHWAMQLFDEEIASADLFGSNPSLSFNYENVYYTASNQSIKAPGRIIWYVSANGSKSPLSGHIRAISYLDSVDSAGPKELFRRYKRLGIYEWKDVFDAAGKDIAKNIKALIFSRTELLTKPIPYEEFCRMRTDNGYAKPNLVGPVCVDNDILEKLLGPQDNYTNND